MIYILTIHWENDNWVDLQLKYIKKNTPEDHKIFTFLNIPTKKHDKKFDYVSHENIKRHASKLNILADLACFDSSDENDILIFLDGDAFPIKEYMQVVRNSLISNTLLAVQRKENLGDIQPHPCFCAIHVKDWIKIKGDWNPGGMHWQDVNGKKITDLGGIVLKKLNEKSLSWDKLLRTNKINPHPLHYGIYGDMVYHHGAGFRNPATRTDLNIANRNKVKTSLYKLLEKIIPHHINKKFFRPMNKVVKKNLKMSEKVFSYITEDPDFFNYFLDRENSENLKYKLIKLEIEKLGIIK
jgi:hypothetical protein